MATDVTGFEVFRREAVCVDCDRAFILSNARGRPRLRCEECAAVSKRRTSRGAPGIYLRLPRALHEAAIARGKADGVSMAEVVRRAIRDHIDRPD